MLDARRNSPQRIDPEGQLRLLQNHLTPDTYMHSLCDASIAGEHPTPKSPTQQDEDMT